MSHVIVVSDDDHAHAAAMRIVLRIIRYAAAANAAVRGKALRWASRRDEGEGGLLWAAACLNRQPLALACAITELAMATGPHRALVRRRLDRALHATRCNIS
jgi:hypothetical protein